MKIATIDPAGIHAQEVKAHQLEKLLPDEWYGYASLEMLDRQSGPMQVDLVICAFDRVLLTEVKNWNGKLTSARNRWQLNGKDMGRSPVLAVADKGRKLASALRIHLGASRCPRVDSCVLLTGSASRSNLPSTEQDFTFEMSFFPKLAGKGTFQTHFPQPSGLLDPIRSIKSELDQFFLKGDFRQLTKAYGDYAPEETPFFRHPEDIYQEFYANKREGRGGYRALLRLWNFDKLATIDPVYRSESGRRAIAFREIDAIGYLKDAQPSLERDNLFLRPIFSEDRNAVTENFYELYELPRDTHRLDDFSHTYGAKLRSSERIGLARTLLSHLATLHKLKVTHRDLGGHSVWLERPVYVALSGFATASFPEQHTITQIRETLRAGSAKLPEDILDEKSDNYRRDVFLLACCIHQILYGKPPTRYDGIPQWQQPTEHRIDLPFDSWFEVALDWIPIKRFVDASEALAAFIAAEPKQLGSDLGIRDFDPFKVRDVPFLIYPPKVTIGSSDLVQCYTSQHGDQDCLVKVWFNARYSDEDHASNFTLLSFLRKAQALKERKLFDCSHILDYGLSPTGLFVVQSWHHGVTLSQVTGELESGGEVLRICLALCRSVQALHEQHLFHEDIKPENILVEKSASGTSVIRLIDILDFAPSGTKRITPAYAPPDSETATAERHDAYAVARIILELLESKAYLLEEFKISEIQKTARELTVNDPAATDLTYVAHALDRELSHESFEPETIETITVTSVRQKQPVTIYPDNEYLYVILERDNQNPSSAVFKISGAQDFALCFFDKKRNGFTGAITRELRFVDSTRIQSKAKWRIPGVLVINPGPTNNFSQLERALAKVLKKSSIEQEAGLETGELEEDAFEPSIDVAGLWKALLEYEEDVLPEASVVAESEPNHSLAVHTIKIGELSRTIDFEDFEQVDILIVRPGLDPSFFAQMDVSRSTNGYIVAKMPLNGSAQPGTRLRLFSRLQKSSLDRRRRAVDRILEKRSVNPRIIECFTNALVPEVVPIRMVSTLNMREYYGLNEAQEKALCAALETSPLSLIQGPPGTGKTHLIAAFVHYSLNHLSARNILLVSQSHEAVNSAADKIISLYERQHQEAPIVRIGMRGILSDDLKPYHTSSLRAAYQARFRADIEQRLMMAAENIELPEAFVIALFRTRMRLLGMCRELEKISEEKESDRSVRLASIIENTVSTLFDHRFDFSLKPMELLEAVEDFLARLHDVTNLRAVSRARTLIDLTLEWADILSEETGGFDQFLVRTRPIVAGTCVGVGRWNLNLEANTFDWVIIDEAARCDPGELAVAMQVGVRVLLVGDHLQLPPLFDKELVKLVCEKTGISDPKLIQKSDFRRIFESSYGGLAANTLRSQYRMVEPIGELVSSCFYDAVGGLKTERGPRAGYFNASPDSLRPSVVWIDTGAPDGHAKEIESGHSYQNEVEANVVLELLEEISANNTFLSALIEDTKLNSLEAGIGIIANYRAQSQLIRQKLMTCPVDLALKDTCKVDTVDSYQGKENPVIIVSLTRCNSRGDSGFVRSAERINVALSRAKESLVIVGSLAFWRDFADSEPLRKVAKYIEGKVNSGDTEFKIISKDPWVGIDDRLKPGDIVSGIVIRLLAYGAFIEIEKNLVGFIHVSEVSWGKEKVRPNDTLEIGERISAKVLQISPEERKMSLSIRELQANPWEEIKRHMRVGGKMSGRVKNLVKFGAFIEIGNGVEGLLHNSDIPNTLPSSSAADVLSLGQEVELMILFIDDLNQRVSLGMKQLDAEAWELSSANNLLGAVVEGTVLRSFGNIVLVILDGGIEGVIEASEGMVLKNNERISVKVVGIDNILQRLNLEFKSK